jgi:WD40 repeat protein
MGYGGDDGQLHLYGIATGSLQTTIATNEKRFRTLQFTPDGTMLIACGHSGVVQFVRIAEV